MLSAPFRRLLAAGLVMACSVQAAQPSAPSLSEALAEAAPLLDRQVLLLAVAAMQCALADGANPAQRLAVIDYSRPSSEPRLWIFDLEARTLLHEELVAHGQKSGDNLARRFSNIVGSNQSSLGLFRAQETYFGRHGYSLRMDGLEPGVNDRARERAIVIHGASYVDEQWVARHGRIGRSHGCPAVRQGVVREVVDSLKNGQFVFSYFPDQDWLASSRYLNCEPALLADVEAAAVAPES